MIVPFLLESLNNKFSDTNTVESRFLEPSASQTSRYLEPNLVSIELASLKLYNFTPNFSNPRFLETPNNSNHVWLPWDKLTTDNSNLREFPNHWSADVNYFHAFKVVLYTIFQRFEYHMGITIVFHWQM